MKNLEIRNGVPRHVVDVARAEERERTRIARGLHDQVGHLLLDAREALEAGPDGIERARELLARALEATRSLTFELGLPAIDEHGLGGALETICRATGARHEIEVVFEEDGEVRRVDEGVALVLSQIVRELLHNVVKHARASCSAVTLTYGERSIRITVQDDGDGIDIARLNPDGFGLADARRRLDELGGRFEFGSKDGFGTRVVLELPVAVTAPH